MEVVTCYKLTNRYEGEIHGGFAHGIGCLYYPKTQSFYLGEFNFGAKQGL